MSNRDLVVIGGSTGAIRPLRTLLSSLPAGFPAAVAVTIHMPAAGSGIFTAVASSAGQLPVETATDGTKLEPGKVYLASPDRHLIITDGHCRLGNGPRENLMRPAVDPLFRSAAASFGPRAIGIVLSGLLNDGADGLKAIKRCGGIALVQAPEDCVAAEMPLAALEATAVDLSAGTPGLAEAVLHYVGTKPGNAREVPDDILLEIEIALGSRLGSEKLRQIAEPVVLTCPDCGGVLSQIKQPRPMRFRCQVGHGHTARTLWQRQENSVDEAMRVALRIVEERAELVRRMGNEARQVGRTSIAELYLERAAEYRGYAETLREAVLKTLRREEEPLRDQNDIILTQVIGPEPEQG